MQVDIAGIIAEKIKGHNRAYERYISDPTKTWACMGCKKDGLKRSMITLGAEVPAPLGGPYHLECAYDVLEKWQAVCAVCGKQFTIRWESTVQGCCPTCEKKKQVKQALSSLRGQLLRAGQHGLVSTLTTPEWIETLKHFRWACAYCGAPFSALDHFIPIVRGGGTTRDNCVPACRQCNSSKNGKHPLEAHLPNAQEIAAYLKSRG